MIDNRLSEDSLFKSSKQVPATQANTEKYTRGLKFQLDRINYMEYIIKESSRSARLLTLFGKCRRVNSVFFRDSFFDDNRWSLCFICFIFSEVLFINKDNVQINSAIRDKEVRLIDVDGTMIGIVSAREAQLIANERELDLVKISPNANPPVCKIMDYGKYLYEQNKREKEARKKQTIIEVKEIRLSAKIEEHDFGFKVKNAIKFLQDGDKVKVSIRFRGREVAYAALGKDVMMRFAETVAEYGKIEKPPAMDGRTMSMIIVPNKK